MNSIKTAIIGLRHLHPRAYMLQFQKIDQISVVAVAEEDEALRNKFSQDFHLSAFPHWEEMLEKDAFDLVFIFLPHNQCLAAASFAMTRGIHVVVEKPMAAESKSATEMVQLAERHQVILTTPYVWRYHPVVRDIKALLETGALGEIIGCVGRCAAGRLERYIDGQAEWILDARQSGGGPMYNLGVHWIDLFNWLLNDQVQAVSGKNVQINQQYNIEDNSFAILTYKKGAVLTLDVSYTVPAAYPHGRDLFISIRGTKGVLSWAPAYEGEKDELFICSDHDSFKGAPIQRRTYQIQPVPGYSGIMGLHYLQDVAQAIIHHRTAPISGRDGVEVLKVVEAIYRSAEQKQLVIV